METNPQVDLHFQIVGDKTMVGCGTCKLYADVAPAFCLVDISDVIAVLDGYSDSNACVNMPETEVIYDDSCPIPCDPCNPSCPAGVCTSLGSCGTIVEIADVLAVLDAYNEVYSCAHDVPRRGVQSGHE